MVGQEQAHRTTHQHGADRASEPVRRLLPIRAALGWIPLLERLGAGEGGWVS